MATAPARQASSSEQRRRPTAASHDEAAGTNHSMIVLAMQQHDLGRNGRGDRSGAAQADTPVAAGVATGDARRRQRRPRRPCAAVPGAIAESRRRGSDDPFDRLSTAASTRNQRSQHEQPPRAGGRDDRAARRRHCRERQAGDTREQRERPRTAQLPEEGERRSRGPGAWCRPQVRRRKVAEGGGPPKEMGSFPCQLGRVAMRVRQAGRGGSRAAGACVPARDASALRGSRGLGNGERPLRRGSAGTSAPAARRDTGPGRPSGLPPAKPLYSNVEPQLGVVHRAAHVRALGGGGGSSTKAIHENETDQRSTAARREQAACLRREGRTPVRTAGSRARSRGRPGRRRASSC